MVSVAIEEATNWLGGGKDGGFMRLARFKAKTASLGPLVDLFLVEELPQVLAILGLVKKRKYKGERKQKRETTKAKGVKQD